jgi:ferrous iron transport protein A
MDAPAQIHEIRRQHSMLLILRGEQKQRLLLADDAKGQEGLLHHVARELITLTLGPRSGESLANTTGSRCRCEPFSSILQPMDATAAPNGVSLAPGSMSLSALTPGTVGAVIGVGLHTGAFSAVERRLLELGFVSGERIEVLAQALPGGDPFVVRVGTTTLALRRREVETVWVEVAPSASPP